MTTDPYEDDSTDRYEMAMDYLKDRADEDPAHTEYVEGLADKLGAANARIRELEQFAQDIAHKLNIPYSPPVAKGDCVYLEVIEKLKEQKAELEARLAEKDKEWLMAYHKWHEAEAEVGKLGASLSRNALRAIDAETRAEKAERRLAEAEARADITEREFCSEQTEHTREILLHGVTKARAEEAERRLAEAEANYYAACDEIVKLEEKIHAGKLIYEVAAEMRKEAEAEVARLKPIAEAAIAFIEAEDIKPMHDAQKRLEAAVREYRQAALSPEQPATESKNTNG